MLNTLTQYRGTQTTKELRPVFGRRQLNELLQPTQEGYAWTKGIHLYSELRPVEGLEVAENDKIAQRYLQTIEDYTHAGLFAAGIFGLELLELQGNVLHFHKEGELTTKTLTEALQFSYLFTKVLYETLADELGDEWRGFAICMDHGGSVVVRHGQTSNGSAISLGPSANRPAKRLLYGKTPAGYVEFPGEWAKPLLGQACQQQWYGLNLRDRSRLPFLGTLENAQLEAQLRQAIVEDRRVQLQARAAQPFVLVEANARIDQGHFSTDQPLRLRAFCLRADLDGFTKQVSAAFQQGEDAVEAIAKGFLKIMDFGDYFEGRHYGTVRLPWAGDCISFLVPPRGELQAFRGKEWVSVVEEWQTFSGATTEGARNQWGKVFQNVAWAVGMTYAERGGCLVALIRAQTRRFLLAAGAPLALANDLQNQGKGGETLIHSSDYEQAYPVVQKLFNKVTNTEAWLGKEISMKKIQQAAIEAGKAENVSKLSFTDKAVTVTVPAPRPHYPSE